MGLEYPNSFLGMTAVVSEDSVRRNFGKLGEAEGVQWLHHTRWHGG